MCVRDFIVRGMQLVRTGSQSKQYGLSSFMKNASFSSGWLHLAVQCFFAVLIVVSFILIILMSIPTSSNKPPPPRQSRCHTTNCIVHCDEVPYFGEYEEDIIYAVTSLPDSCTGFLLVLRHPMFINETLSSHLLPRLRLPIKELSIFGGNLKHFPPDAFLNQHSVNIRTISLTGIVISTWTTDSLVGLSNLREIFIQECTILNIQPHVFRPVHDTLETLTITYSNQWDPANITGTTNLRHLTTVDFSHNRFYDVLDRNSFTAIENCRILYLNSCKISAIGLGAFDNLRLIEILFLNNNFLVTVPGGLFTNIAAITAFKPRINLQDNMWHCDCCARELRGLVAKDMLLTDPTCHSPDAYRSKTFFEFESFCRNIEALQVKDDSEEAAVILPPIVSLPATHASDDISGFVYINNGCHNGHENTSNSNVRLMSPARDRQCVANNIQKVNFRAISRSINELMSNNTWVKFTFVLRSKTFSMVQLTAAETDDYGIVWFQSSCPNEVYCVNAIPSALRVYNVDMSAEYIFCPIVLASGSIDNNKCVSYNLAALDYEGFATQLQILFYICTGGICLVVGACCVYLLVRKHPHLLKGSKRILFVKHKTVDALVLPPKVPIRKELVNEIPQDLNEKNIFLVSTSSYGLGKFNRNISTRSSKSTSPSYISALQPTEEQLAQWRIQNHFTNDPTSDVATYSWLCSADSFHYMDVIDNEKTYESLN